jgi:hypothetical protein
MYGRENNDFAHDETIQLQLFPKLFQCGLAMVKPSGVENIE